MVRIFLITCLILFQQGISFEFEERFENIEINYNDLLGKGSFAKVYRSKSTNTGKIYATKVVNLSLMQDSKEVEMLKLVTMAKIPNAVSLKYYYLDEANNKEYLGFDLYEQDLMNYNKYLKDTNARKLLNIQIANKLLEALKALHRINIAHLDVKPENVFLNSHHEPFLGDFGSAVRLSAEQTVSGMVGTLKYMAPEILDASKTAGLKADVWSMGITFYSIFTAREPFIFANSPVGVLRSAKELDGFHFGEWKYNDTTAEVDYKKLILFEMLEFDQNKRISAVDTVRKCISSSVSLKFLEKPLEIPEYKKMFTPKK